MTWRIIINIKTFNHDLASCNHLNFLPQTDDDPVGAMGEKWEMVFNQNHRLSIWRFIGAEKEWYCLDLFIGDTCDSFEMEQFAGTTWTRTETHWLPDLDEVIEFVSVLAKAIIQEDI